MTDKVADYITLASLIGSGQMRYDAVFSFLADANLNAYIYEIIGEYAYDGSYFDLEWVIQQKLGFYMIKHEFIQQCIVRHLRNKADKNLSVSDEEFRINLDVLRDLILEPHIKKTDLSTGQIMFPVDESLQIIKKSAIRREDGFNEIVISPANLWLLKSQVESLQLTSPCDPTSPKIEEVKLETATERQTRLLSRKMAEKAKGNRAFCKTVAKEEGISEQRLDQLIRAKPKKTIDRSQ